jgi:hypothetical protein
VNKPDSVEELEIFPTFVRMKPGRKGEELLSHDLELHTTLQTQSVVRILRHA